ncbi:3-oxoacyl-[acyl-carrier protein] reductase [Thermocatellispora tengchongensis]|uniref:3-oxoacyl-[acyl-carrier protein] reductase n=1 Tax=Thermocatellispora tengchongensis TaxID=1073253 RepID=A0A840PMP4_9ACTN|nr:SDR family oxidoreductase [Thermocatellispora tengchongensis]MBB5138307.1 3-oxoacyl-[acyl-carrier protein] reductase [Thermocatellispora tengchongensis]
MDESPKAGARGTALVTGASRGLGAVIAERLAADGWHVAVNYAHDTAGATAVAGRIAAAGGAAHVARFDVTDEDAVRDAVAEITDRAGPIALLVNNATGPQPTIPVEKLTWEDHLAQLRFFVKAPLLLLQAVLPAMRAAGGGRIVNVGSEVTDLGNPEMSHYVSAKAAMHGLTRSWARELGPLGITVNTVEPGWIPVERHGEVTDEDTAPYLAGVALGHMGVPADVAEAVAFLASPGARYITGQRLAVNGGKTMT